MKKIVAILLALLMIQNSTYAFEQISWDKIEVIPKETESEPVDQRRRWLGGQFVRFILDENAVPADYGYTDPTVQYLYDVEVSPDGFVFEKNNKKVPYGGHRLKEIGEYFVLEYILFIPAGKEDLFDSPPQYIYNQDWDLVKAVKAGEEVDFGAPVRDTEDNTIPFSQYPVIKELNGWFYCKNGNMTQDGYMYYPVKFQNDKLKRTEVGLDGYTYMKLSWGLNDTRDKDIVSYDNIYWYELPMYNHYNSVWEYDGYMYIENEDSYYKMKLEPPNNPYVILDGELLAFEEIPVRENDSLLVPMRFMFEQMGAEVDWNQQTKTATAALAGNAVTFSIDSLNATVNKAPQQMEVPARLVNDTTMIPLRFLSENLGYTVTWDQEAQAAFIEE